jgi:DNA polymerase-3 subunit epsilon
MKMTDNNADTVIVLDFETTGLSPDQGERAIEIGAVKLVDGFIVDTFQQLMYPGKRINYFIENYTGITNSMLEDAPPCGEVMSEFSEFIDGFNLVAHNASFDSRFLDAELRRIKRQVQGEFACSMLIARRLYPDAPNHKLGTLVSYIDLPNDGTFHRALADSQMTAHLWLAMIDEIKNSYPIDFVPFTLMQQLSRTAKASVSHFLQAEAISR